jgi:hypothetical protein
MALNPSPYDPTGEAGVWQEASELAAQLKVPDGMPADQHDYWNAAVQQVARELEKRGREIRQSNGMYYRVLNGESMPA